MSNDSGYGNIAIEKQHFITTFQVIPILPGDNALDNTDVITIRPLETCHYIIT